MADSSDRERPRHVCPWCGKPPTDEESGRGVCRRCASLLRGAGVPDQEIYGGEDKEDGKD